MENEKIVVKGTPKKNRIARRVLLIGIAAVVISFMVAFYQFNYGEHFSFSEVLGYERGIPYHLIYRSNFFVFYIAEFFGPCIYGYMLTAGVTAIVVGLIMKLNTEKCEITVTDKRIYGKVARGKKIDIPLNQVTALHTCSFDGVSVASIGNISDFHCIANHEAVMQAIANLLANPQKTVATNGADELKQLKELLDGGIITQEEFDAKKKEILR